MNSAVFSRLFGLLRVGNGEAAALAGLAWPWVLAVVLCWPMAGEARGFVEQQAWLEDAGGQMGWDEVRRAPMQVFTGVLNRGYSSAPLWLRLRIDPAADGRAATPDARLVLRIRPVYLDRIEVFDPLAGGYAGVVGDNYHPRRDAMQSMDFLFPIARGTEPRDVWLRLSTASSRQIHVQVLRADQLPRAQLQQGALASMYIGTSVVLMIWGGVAGWLQRERVLALFGLMQLGGLLYGLSSLGFLRVVWPLWLSAGALDMAGSVFAIAALGTGVWFHLRFLQEFQPARWALWLMQGVLALALADALLLALGQVMPALRLNMLSAGVASVFGLLAALTARVWKQEGGVNALVAPAVSKGWLVGLYVMLLVMLVIAATTGVGWMRATTWSIYVSQAQSLVTSLLLLMMLQYRAHARNRQREQALLALERTRLQVAHEQAAREEQGKLLAMLAHEIKTPLATMHMRLDPNAQGSEAIRSAMRDMNEVIERCMQTLRMDESRLAPRPQRLNLVDVLRGATASCSQPRRVVLNLPDEIRAETDPQIVFIIISNVLENACKYAQPDTPVTMVCTPVPGAAMAHVAIANQPGRAGWPDPERIFEKYYRAPQAQRYSGTGLGLYLVRSLIRSLGGEVHYTPDASQVRFVLDVPLQPRVERAHLA